MQDNRVHSKDYGLSELFLIKAWYLSNYDQAIMWWEQIIMLGNVYIKEILR